MTCPPNLTRRDRAILHLIIEGKSNAEIGAALGLTTGTARIQAHALLKKAGTRSRVVLAVRAVREGWLAW